MKYGERVNNTGDQSCDLAIRKNSNIYDDHLEWIRSIHTDKSKNIRLIAFSTESFFPSNSLLHPGICYGRYLVHSSSPYFYGNVAYMSGAAVEELDNERIKVVDALNELDNRLNINNSSILSEWNNRWGISGSNMHQCIANSESLQNITVDRNIHSDANHRYFKDDIPFGLCFIKYVAVLLGVDTPFIDRVIRWAQTTMDKKYLDRNNRLIVESLPKYYSNLSIKDLFHR